MSGAAKITIVCRVAVQQFVGYCLWGVARRTRSKQQWKDSAKTYGRADTIDQAWGCVAELVNDLPVDSVRDDTMFFSWKTARDQIRQPGEARRFEGSIAWAGVSAERRQELQARGDVFNERLKFAERERQRLKQEQDRAYYQQFCSINLNTLPVQYLKVLGLGKDVCDIVTIKSAYRKLVAKHHPDKGGDGQQFIKIRKAYEALAKLAC